MICVTVWVIKTTLPKAKELRRVIEPIITLGKKPSLANRRLAFDRLRDRDMVVKVFDELGPRYASRNGGYLRILKCGFRDGDNAPMAFVELLDRPDSLGDAATAALQPDLRKGQVTPGFFCRRTCRSESSSPAGVSPPAADIGGSRCPLAGHE